MVNYIVLYRIESIMSPMDEPFVFACLGDDIDHAEEQCLNAYPDCDIVWTHLGSSYDDALEAFYHWEECNLALDTEEELV